MPSPFVLFVSGSRDSGKTKTCLEIFEHFSKLGLSVGGIITVKSGRSENFGEKRFVIDLATNKRALLAVRKSGGGYRFMPAGVRFANRAISEFSGDILIIDEVGKLEKRGSGFQEIVRKLKSSPPKAVVISCRDTNVKWLEEKLGRKIVEIKTEDAGSIEQALKLIADAVVAF